MEVKKGDRIRVLDNFDHLRDKYGPTLKYPHKGEEYTVKSAVRSVQGGWKMIFEEAHFPSHASVEGMRFADVEFVLLDNPIKESLELLDKLEVYYERT